MNFRYSSDEIEYCLDLADVEVLVFGPELFPVSTRLSIRSPASSFCSLSAGDSAYAEDCCRLMGFCSSSAPPVALTEEDEAAIYFSSGTTVSPRPSCISTARFSARV